MSRAGRAGPVHSSFTGGLLALLVTGLLLSACGFTLRTDDAGQLNLGQMQLQSGLNPELTATIRSELERAGVELTTADTDTPAPWQLRLSEEALTQRSLSVNTRARGAEYEMELDIDAELYLDGELLAGPETLSVRHQHDLDPANISASDREMQAVLEELHLRIGQLLVRRLASVQLPAQGLSP